MATVAVPRVRVPVLVLLALAAVAAPLCQLGAPTAIRAPLGFVAVLLVPGMAITGFLRLADALTEVLVAVVLSITVAAFGTQLMLAFTAWGPTAYLVGVCAASCPCLALHAWRSARPGS